MIVSDLDETVVAELEQLVNQLTAQSGNCAQSSFAALDQYFSLDGARVLRALTAMPGVGLRGETCGVVLGALLALGLVFGRDDLSDIQAMRRSLPPAREFCRRFEKYFGSTSCQAILEKRLGRTFDLSTIDGYSAYCGCGGVDSCAEVVRVGVITAGKIIVEHPTKNPENGVMLTV